jgi:uncharacterized protein YoxC
MLDTMTPLQSFLERIRNISFFQRLFSWNKVRTQLMDAFSALSRLNKEIEILESTRAQMAGDVAGQRKDIKLLEEQKTRLEEAQKRYHDMLGQCDNRIAELSASLTTVQANFRNAESQVNALRTELAETKESLRQVQQNLRQSRDECIHLQNEEEARKREHSKALDTFQKWREQIQAERNREIEERQQAELKRLKDLKQTWNEHEATVKARMKVLCQKHTIEYADAVPFKGTPDNAIKLCNEYIVFDAKSPGTDDPNNFPTYLKDQAEKAKKYAKLEDVKKDVFFVVPSNTLDVLRQTVFALGDYEVFVVSIDVLEPLLLCLQKIETYEFAEQLTPEERENICRIIGRFTHLTKRRIQIDSFFARQFMEMVLKCDSDLPEDIKREVAAFEKAEKLNPPSDRRTKTLDNKELQKDMLQLELEIKSKGIVTSDISDELNKLKLYDSQ